MKSEKVNIGPMTEYHRQSVISMMRDFYSSDAVLSNGSDEIFNRDISACVGENPFLEGFVFEVKGEIVGYSMLSRGYSTESGKNRIWLEDLYVKEKYRAFGIGSIFMEFLCEKYADCVIRLDVEEENESAVKFYSKHGFKVIPYMEMIKND